MENLSFSWGRFGTTSFKVAMFTSGSFKNEVAVLEERPRNTVNQLERTVALVPRWENNSFPLQGVFVSIFVHWRDLNCYRPIPCKHWVAVSCLPRVGVGGGQVLFKTISTTNPTTTIISKTIPTHQQATLKRSKKAGGCAIALGVKGKTGETGGDRGIFWGDTWSQVKHGKQGTQVTQGWQVWLDLQTGPILGKKEVENEITHSLTGLTCNYRRWTPWLPQ